MNVFGRIVTGEDVVQHVMASVKTWGLAYLAEVASQAGMERCVLPTFRSITTANDVANFPENQLPACIVTAPEVPTEPSRRGDGTYEATWLVGVAALCSARDQPSTDRLVRLYTAALRALFIQNPSLALFGADGEKGEPFAEQLQWIGETYDQVSTDKRRSLAAGIVYIDVTVADVISSKAGPGKPPIDPCVDPGDYGIVESTPLRTKGMDS